MQILINIDIPEVGGQENEAFSRLAANSRNSVRPEAYEESFLSYDRKVNVQNPIKPGFLHLQPPQASPEVHYLCGDTVRHANWYTPTEQGNVAAPTPHNIAFLPPLHLSQCLMAWASKDLLQP
ncbi:hypothetical protein Tco_1031475 [Tanacetum coccineum]|uniref:Uncharacterized protein n=1 Tax=Tanacetum coccineum TaxID=301880 RepID=A0ABQ5G9C5_9ASTR